MSFQYYLALASMAIRCLIGAGRGPSPLQYMMRRYKKLIMKKRRSLRILEMRIYIVVKT